jgi:profilin
MSWQDYINDHLMYEISAGHTLTAAAIIGHNGSVWAQSDNFPELKDGEVQRLLDGFEDVGSLAMNGLYLGGLKYLVVQGDPGIVVRGKKGPGGCCARKTNQVLVIGLYDEPCTPGECNVVVEKLGDYLYDQGF